MRRRTASRAARPTWDVTVPGWRGDVTREEDLIEEVARCAGYDRLPVTFPALAAPPAKTAPRLVRDARVRDVLVGAGFAEAVTFTFIERAAAAPFDAAPIAIANPLSELFAVLRPSVVPGVVDSLSHNRRREQRDIRLFEVGTRFTRAHGESRSVAIAWTGAAAAEHWSGSGRTGRPLRHARRAAAGRRDAAGADRRRGRRSSSAAGRARGPARGEPATASGSTSAGSASCRPRSPRHADCPPRMRCSWPNSISILPRPTTIPIARR